MIETFDQTKLGGYVHRVLGNSNNDGYILLEDSIYNITDNFSFPENVEVIIRKGSKFVISSGKTLTIPILTCGPHRIFYGEGSAVVNSYPQYSVWWDGIQTGTTFIKPKITEVVNVGSSGSTRYDYKIAVLFEDGRVTELSDSVSILTGSSILDENNYNSISWEAYPNAYKYLIFRTVSNGNPSSLGLLNVQSGTT